MHNKHPTPGARRLHEKLSEMARRGTEHEAAVAKEKLARLEARFDFLGAPAEELEDIFAAWPKPKPSHESKPLVTVPTDWQDVGNIVKWIFYDKFGIATTWKVTRGKAVVNAAAAADDLARLRPLAKTLSADIRKICTEYFGGRKTSELDRSPFLSGFYEGLMDESRATGRIVPGRSPLAKKKKKRTKFSKEPPMAALHPYDQGRELGKQMRINVPVESLCETIRLSLAEQENPVSGCGDK